MSVEGKEWQPNKPCTLCRNWHGEVLSLHQGVAVIRCRNCGLHYVDSLPLTEKQKAEQGKIDLERGPTYLHAVYETKGSQWARYYTEWLLRIGNWTTGRKLLEIGYSYCSSTRAGYKVTELAGAESNWLDWSSRISGTDTATCHSQC